MVSHLTPLKDFEPPLKEASSGAAVARKSLQLAYDNGKTKGHALRALAL